MATSSSGSRLYRPPCSLCSPRAAERAFRYPAYFASLRRRNGHSQPLEKEPIHFYLKTVFGGDSEAPAQRKAALSNVGILCFFFKLL
ncbi:MAG: hypothetical protein M0Z72_01585 [Deltaproteobacteria bacterium]|nr:hypothetical protein [Deltaproteobacteria bacterium]